MFLGSKKASSSAAGGGGKGDEEITEATVKAGMVAGNEPPGTADKAGKGGKPDGKDGKGGKVGGRDKPGQRQRAAAGASDQRRAS